MQTWCHLMKIRKYVKFKSIIKIIDQPSPNIKLNYKVINCI